VRLEMHFCKMQRWYRIDQELDSTHEERVWGSFDAGGGVCADTILTSRRRRHTSCQCHLHTMIGQTPTVSQHACGRSERSRSDHPATATRPLYANWFLSLTRANIGSAQRGASMHVRAPLTRHASTAGQLNN